MRLFPEEGENATEPLRVTLTFIFEMYKLVELHDRPETQDYTVMIIEAMLCGSRPHRDVCGCEIYA
jgi:hypothetical protein